MSLLNDLPELIKAGIISEETAGKIREYYQSQARSSSQRLYLVFGILGAILVGLGIILIIAHNWDELSRSTKSFFAFLPLLLGQFFCGFSLFRKQVSLAWREGSATFLFFAVGGQPILGQSNLSYPGRCKFFYFDLDASLLSVDLCHEVYACLFTLPYRNYFLCLCGELLFLSVFHPICILAIVAGGASLLLPVI